ncbi:hypothetical protein [Pacificibacter maritimus]|nr:hypothetical protein [Pacificibacter maritimus]
MNISFHIGAHYTYGSTLMRGLLKNRSTLEQHGIIVPSPARYREVLPQMMKRVKNSRATAEAEQIIIEDITEMDACDRVVMSYEDLICQPQAIFHGGRLYGKAQFKLKWLRNVFPNSEMEFHIGVRNPATFIPEAVPDPAGYAEFIGETDLDSILWSDFIKSVRAACPDVPVTVFAYEDTPLTWAQIMRELAGLGPMVPIDGGLDILAMIMKREGMKRLRTYLNTHRPQNELQRRRILAAFLDKYVDEDAIEEEIDLPGWDDALITRLTDRYEDDLYEIEDIPGVRFIQP